MFYFYVALSPALTVFLCAYQSTNIQGPVRLGHETLLTLNVAVQGYCKLPLLSNTAKFSGESVTQGICLRKVPPTSECPHGMVSRSHESRGSLKLCHPCLRSEGRKGIKTNDKWVWDDVDVFYLYHQDKET